MYIERYYKHNKPLKSLLRPYITVDKPGLNPLLLITTLV